MTESPSEVAEGWSEGPPCAASVGANYPTVPLSGAAPEGVRPLREHAIEALWRQAYSWPYDEACLAWIRAHGGDRNVNLVYRYCRAVPHEVALPAWATHRGSAGVSQRWTSHGYRLLFPLYDRDGCLRSLRAQNVEPPVSGRLSALSPPGHHVAGLVMADPIAREALENGPDEDPWRFVIAEGEAQFLAWCNRSEHGRREGILGVAPGSWQDDEAGQTLAARLPAGSDVTLCTYRDARGEAQARVIAATLAGRCAVRRWAAPGVRGGGR